MTTPEDQAAEDRRPSPRGLAVSSALLLVAGVASRAASDFIGAAFADRPMPRDLLLDAVPYWEVAQYVADAAVLLAVIVLALYYGARMPKSFPRGIAMFGLMYLLRSAIVVLTPLASPHGSETFGLLPPQTGMFPSGHMGNVVLCVMLAHDAGSRPLRLTMLALAVVESAALLLSRGHYSIDLVGGLLLAYFVHEEWTRGRLFGPLKRLVG